MKTSSYVILSVVTLVASITALVAHHKLSESSTNGATFSGRTELKRSARGVQTSDFISREVRTSGVASSNGGTSDKFVSYQDFTSKGRSTCVVSKNSSQMEPPESIRTILNLEGGVHFSRRIDAVHSLGRNLDRSELDYLFKFLSEPKLQNGMETVERWLRNDVMDKLVTQETIPDGLANLFISIYEDSNQDAVMRDYAVQHMPVVYEMMTSTEQASVRQVMWRATKETNNSIAGTALLALLEILEQTSQLGFGPRSESVERTRLATTALNLASDDRCGDLARITAVSVCGRLRVEEALPILLNLAQGTQNVPLRIVAVAGLGDIGGTTARTVLRQLTTDSDQRVRIAAESALRRLVNS